MSLPLTDRPDDELERDLVNGNFSPRKKVIAEEVLRRRYLIKGWTGWLRLMWLRVLGSKE